MSEFGSAVPGGDREAYGGIVSTVPVPVGVVTAEGIAYCNEAARSFFETTGDEQLAGRRLTELAHQNDRRRVRQAIAIVREDDDYVEVTARFRTTKGEVREADASMTPSPTGQDDAVTVTLRSTSDASRGRSARRREIDDGRDRVGDGQPAAFDRFVRRLLDALTDPVFVVDDRGRVTFVNEPLVETVGRERAALVGSSPETFLASGTERDAWATLAEDDRGRVELDLRTADVDRIPHEVATAPLSGPSGDDYLVALAHDVSERKRNARKLRRQNERLEEFAQTVSHDLRNPLEVARTNLRRLTADPETVEEIDDALDRMNDLIADLLALTSEGQVVDETEVMSLATLSTDCWHTVATGDADLQVDGDPWIRADRGQLRSLLENLFRNSIEHGSEADPSPSDDRVEESVAVDVGPVVEDGEQIGFYVEDDGPGIDPAHRDRIFESGFSTADSTGIGLVIVDQIARAHGWSITVTSASDGSAKDRGARFEFTGVETVERGVPER